MPGTLFEEVVDGLYRDDAFMKGTLVVAGRPARPEAITAPVLSVVDPRSTIIPAAAIAPFMAALPNPANRVLHYDGDTGVALQHVGALVGATAHTRLWPRIIAWLAAPDRPMPLE
jgi:polyhydroxyalkanoate synthase